MNAGEFARREVDGLALYVCRALEQFPHVRHAFSTRLGGCSPLPEADLNLGRVAWDDIRAVRENRRRFLSAAGLESFPLATLYQVHSDYVYIIEEIPVAENVRPEGDALVTGLKRVAIAVQVADCFPVLLASENAVAAVHAGWRGAALRIAAKAAECMRRNFRSDLATLRVAIGPGIRACCFEVGAEVVDRFQLALPGRDVCSNSHADLPMALRAQLVDAGVKDENIHDLGLCTRCNTAEFFSYRGEGARTGRMMGVIAIDKPASRNRQP